MTVESNIEGLFEKAGTLDHVVYTAGDSLALMPIGDATMEKMIKAGMVRIPTLIKPPRNVKVLQRSGHFRRTVPMTDAVLRMGAADQSPGLASSDGESACGRICVDANSHH